MIQDPIHWSSLWKVWYILKTLFKDREMVVSRFNDLAQSYKDRVVRWGLNPSLSIYVSTAFPQLSAENRTCSLGQRNYLTDIICICFANASKHLSIHLTVLQVFDQHHHCTMISANLKNWAKVKKNTPFPWAKHTGLRIVKAKGSAWASQSTRIGLLP